MYERTILACAVFFGAIAVASCSGAKESDLFSSSTSSSGSSGASGTSGSSGSSGSSGTSGTSGSSGDPPVRDSGTKSCEADKATCDSDEYCRLPVCTALTGTCVKKPDEPSPTLVAVCGCDGVTYWNADVAALNGVSVFPDTGVCTAARAKKCTSAGKGCTGKTRCSLDRGDASFSCQVPSATEGTCWGLPDQCPQGPTTTRPCDGFGRECMSLCKAIADVKPFYKDGTCP